MSSPIASTRRYEIQVDDNHGIPPTANSSPSPQGQIANTTPAGKDLPLPAIIGGGVAGLVLIGIVVLCAYIWYRKKYPVRMVLGKDFQRFSNPAYTTKKMSDLKLIVEDPLAAYDVPLEQVNEGFIPDDEASNETVPDDADKQKVNRMKANGGYDKETADESVSSQKESDHIEPVPPMRKTKQAMLVRSDESENVEVINEFELESKDEQTVHIVVEETLNNELVESSDFKSSTAETNDKGSSEIVPHSSKENVNKQSIENEDEEDTDSSFTTRRDISEVSGRILEREHDTEDDQDYIRSADKDSGSEKSLSNSDDNIFPEGQIEEVYVRDTSVDLSLECEVESNTMDSNNTLLLSVSSVATAKDTNICVEHLNEEEKRDEIKHEIYHSNEGEIRAEIKNEIQDDTASCKSDDSKCVTGESFDTEVNNSVDNLDGGGNFEMLASNPDAFQAIKKVIDIQSEDAIDVTRLSPSFIVIKSDELIVGEQGCDIAPVYDSDNNSHVASPNPELNSPETVISDTFGTDERNITNLSHDLQFHSDKSVADNFVDKHDDDTKIIPLRKYDDDVEIDSGQFKALDCQSMQGKVLKLDIDAAVLSQDFPARYFTDENRRVLSTDNIVIECPPPTPVIVQDDIILEPDMSHMDNRYSSVPDIREQRSFTFNLDHNSSDIDRPRQRRSFDNHRNLTETLSDSFQSLIANKSKDSQEISSVLQEELAFNRKISGSLEGIEFENPPVQDLTQITAGFNLEAIGRNDTRGTVGHSEDILRPLSQSETNENEIADKEINYSIDEEIARSIQENCDISDVSSLKNNVETYQSMDTLNSFEVIGTSTESVSTVDKALILTSAIPKSCIETRLSGEIEQSSDSDVSTDSACSKSLNLDPDSTKDINEPYEVPTFPIAIGEQSASRTTDSAHLLKIDASGFTFDDESENASSTTDESIDVDDDSLEVIEEDESNA